MDLPVLPFMAENLAVITNPRKRLHPCLDSPRNSFLSCGATASYEPVPELASFLPDSISNNSQESPFWREQASFQDSIPQESRTPIHGLFPARPCCRVKEPVGQSAFTEPASSLLDPTLEQPSGKPSRLEGWLSTLCLPAAQIFSQPLSSYHPNLSYQSAILQLPSHSASSQIAYFFKLPVSN